MKQIVSFFLICIGFVWICYIWIGNSIGNPSEHETYSSDRSFAQDEETLQTQNIVGTRESDVRQDYGSVSSDNFAERKELVHLHPDRYFNPANSSQTYLRNLNRHFSISRYIHSPIKEDPSMQNLMILLLENGYEVTDWNAVVNMLTVLNKSLDIRRNNLIDQNLSETEIKTELEKYQQTSPHVKAVINGLKITADIGEGKLLDAILELDFPSLGFAETLKDPTTTIFGDKLLTDEDWFTAEFLAAKGRYKGAPRRSSYGGRIPLIPAPGHEEAYRKAMMKQMP